MITNTQWVSIYVLLLMLFVSFYYFVKNFYTFNNINRIIEDLYKIGSGLIDEGLEYSIVWKWYNSISYSKMLLNPFKWRYDVEDFKKAYYRRVTKDAIRKSRSQKR